MDDDDRPKEERDANVLVFRNDRGAPVIVPDAVATEAERAYRCYKLRSAGMSWTEIALAEEYPSAGSAKADVDRYMGEATSLVTTSTAKAMLAMEVNRLDAVQHALWAAAMSGHVPSATAVVNIIINRAKLTGLDPDRMAMEADRSRTVVVPTSDDGYVASLMRAAGEPPRVPTEET